MFRALNESVNTSAMCLSIKKNSYENFTYIYEKSDIKGKILLTSYNFILGINFKNSDNIRLFRRKRNTMKKHHCCTKLLKVVTQL